MRRHRRLGAVATALTVVLAAAPAAASPTKLPATQSFVTRCGVVFCLQGKPFPMAGGSVLYGLDHPERETAVAAQAGLTFVRIVNFLDESGDPATAPYDEARWAKVDQLVAAARARHLKVELDLSTYRNLLQTTTDPYAADWGPFLTFVATRVNTVTHVRYRDDPTIALVGFAGEDDPPGAPPHGPASARALTAFYSRVTQQWHHLDPRHLLTAGGLFHLSDAGPAGFIDWRSICALRFVSVCAVHTYSLPDERAERLVSAWSATHHRIWMVEEFGLPRSHGDRARAAYLDHESRLAMSLGAAGIGIWNVGVEAGPDTYDVGPADRLAYAALKKLRRRLVVRLAGLTATAR